MPLFFSPVDQTELIEPYKPRPRTAFLMQQLDGNATQADHAMAEGVRAALADVNFAMVTAADIRGTGDFLHKILNLIRGCGFAVAIFSDRAPPRTLANIFFEVGLAAMLGKPVQLVLTGQNPAPSDFVRSEWIAYEPGNDAVFTRDMRESLGRINELAGYYREIGEVALEADRPDLELAFERFVQAILIGNDAGARDGIDTIRTRLLAARAGPGADDMTSHRERLYKSASEFLRLLPRLAAA